MFAAFANIAKIPELRKKTVWTLGLLVLARVGVFIPLPGVNLSAVSAAISGAQGTGLGDFLGILDMFSGGGLKERLDFRPRYHAVYFGIDYFSALKRHCSRASESRQGRRKRPAQDQSMDALLGGRALHRSGFDHLFDA